MLVQGIDLVAEEMGKQEDLINNDSEGWMEQLGEESDTVRRVIHSYCETGEVPWVAQCPVMVMVMTSCFSTLVPCFLHSQN